MKLLNRTILIVLVSMMWGISIAQIPEKPATAVPIVDLAGIINNDSLVNELNAQLDTLSKQTQNQIVVVTVNDMGGIDPKEFATELGKSWGVGGSRLNNGLVMVVKPKNENGPGQIGFATGYGLEGALPDVFCKRLQADYMVPHFKDGDYAGGIKAAIDEIVPVVLDEYKHTQALAGNEATSKKGGGNGWFIIAGILGIIALFMLLRKRSKPAGVAQQPQQSNLTSEKEQEPTHEEEKEVEEEEDKEEESPNDDDQPSNPEQPKPYKYGYGGGDFGGGGASTEF